MHEHASGACGCGHEHAHDGHCDDHRHDGCCGERPHDECGCGRDHGHAHSHDGCGCGHDHHDHHHHREGCGCGEGMPAAGPFVHHRHEAEPVATEFNFSYGGLRLHGRRWGDAAEWPVVMLHGFMQSRESWAFVASELEHDHCVYVLDLVGHGESDKPTDPAVYDYDAVVEMVAQFLDKVACVNPETGERRKAHVVGYSMGGRIALRLMALHPELLCSVVLESCGLGPADEDERAAARERNYEWGRLLREDGIEAFVDYWEGLDLFATQRERGVDSLLRPGRLANDAQAMALVAERMGKHAMPLKSEALASISTSWLPILYICGEKDPAAQRAAHEIHHCGGEVVQAATGHNVHLEAPLLYLRVVQNFLAGNELRGWQSLR